MNSLLMIIGMIVLSNGNISLLNDDKNESNKYPKAKTMVRKSVSKNNNITLNNKENDTSTKSTRYKKVKKKVKRKTQDDLFKFNLNDINNGMKMIDLSEEDIERGIEIITRTKKYMSSDEKKVLIKLESMLDLVRGIKKLSASEFIDDEYESDFFRSMEEEDKKNMMIKEILEVFPEKRRDSVEKALDMKKKIDLFAELFLPEDMGEGGFSLSSLANINNLGSLGNLSVLGNLLRGDNKTDSNQSSKYTYVDSKVDEYEDNEIESYYDEYDDYEYEDIEKLDEYLDEKK